MCNFDWANTQFIATCWCIIDYGLNLLDTVPYQPSWAAVEEETASGGNPEPLGPGTVGMNSMTLYREY